MMMVIAAVTLAAFAPVLLSHAGFVMWDDNAHIAQSLRFSPPSLSWLGEFWCHAYFGLYVPVTYTVWLIVGSLFSTGAPMASAGGAWVPAWPFHVLNILTHAAVVCVAWRLLRAISIESIAACFGALVVAVHPLQVEPVAWISGYRDVLGGLLTLLALLAILRSVDDPKRTLRWYALASVLFVLALLAKPSAANTPLLAIVLFYGFRDVSWKRSLALLLPWCVGSLACLYLTRSLQPSSLPTAHVSIVDRFLVAADALGFYTWKTVLPYSLGIDYGRTPVWVVTQGWKHGFWAIPLALAVCFRWMNRRARAAVLWIVVGLLPVLGLVPFNFQSYSTVADRYMYVSMVGVGMLLAFLLSARPSLKYVASALLAIWAVLSGVQETTWTNTTSLFTHAMNVNPASFVAPATFAAVALDDQNPALALQLVNRSIENNPSFATARLAAGNAYRMLGRLPDAEAAYRAATEIEPANSAGWSNLAAVLGQEGNTQAGLNAADIAIRLEPDSPDVHVNAGILMAQASRMNEAVDQLRNAVALAPAHLSARMNLAILLFQMGDADGARAQVRIVLTLYPSYQPARSLMQQLQHPK